MFLQINGGPFSKGRYSENKNKLKLTPQKTSFSRTSRPISIIPGTNHPWVKGIQNHSNKGPSPLQREDNHKNVKIGWVSSKNLLKNYWTRKTQIYMKAI
jgi:hypothetical protein